MVGEQTTNAEFHRPVRRIYTAWKQIGPMIFSQLRGRHSTIGYANFVDVCIYKTYDRIHALRGSSQTSNLHHAGAHAAGNVFYPGGPKHAAQFHHNSSTKPQQPGGRGVPTVPQQFLIGLAKISHQSGHGRGSGSRLRGQLCP